MTTMTHDTAGRGGSHDAGPRAATGVLLALVSALSFSLSGPVGKGLIDQGWTPGAAVTARVLIAAAVLAIPAAVALRGRWHLLRKEAGTILAFGAVAVAGCQLAYFSAVARMDVAVALLIEFTSPVAVLVWTWLRHGHRPSRLTFLGAATAIAGLALVIDLTSGADLDGLGIVWALGAMLGAACYWILSGNESELPGVVLAATGLLVGGLVLLLAGAVGVLSLTATRSAVELGGADVPWWVALLVLGAVTAGLAYAVGILAVRRLGSRVASFLGLSEAVLGVVMAWLLLSETPRPVQLVGGALVLVGVLGVRLGEPAPPVESPALPA